LREEFNQDDRGHHWMPWEMALEVEIVSAGPPAPGRRLARGDVYDFLDKPHRRLVRQLTKPGHQAATVYCAPFGHGHP
jgi:hypothetical protein